TSRAQEGGNAVCSYEANLQTRPASAAGLERRQGRGAAHRNCPEFEAACQAPLSFPAAGGNLRRLSLVSGVGARKSMNGGRHKSMAKTHSPTRPQEAIEFGNTFTG